MIDLLVVFFCIGAVRAAERFLNNDTALDRINRYQAERARARELMTEEERTAAEDADERSFDTFLIVVKAAVLSFVVLKLLSKL